MPVAMVAKPTKKVSKKPEVASISKKEPVKINLDKKRNMVIAGIILGIVSLLVIFGLFVNSQNSSKINVYLKSKAFADYSASMKQYLQTSGGIYPKVYACNASLIQLWHPPVSPLSKTKDKLEIQLARQLIDLKPKWEKVSLAYPSYSKYFFFKVFPMDHAVYKKYQTAANLMDGSSKLINHTQDYGYYCPGFLYPGIYNFSYLEDYSKKAPITDSSAVITQRMQALITIGNTYGAAKTPKDWTTTQKAYLSFLHKTLADLTALRDQRAKNPAGTNMAAAFASDQKALEQTITIGAKTGQKIGPNQDQLAKLFWQTIKK